MTNDSLVCSHPITSLYSLVHLVDSLSAKHCIVNHASRAKRPSLTLQRGKGGMLFLCCMRITVFHRCAIVCVHVWTAREGTKVRQLISVEQCEGRSITTVKRTLWMTLNELCECCLWKSVQGWNDSEGWFEGKHHSCGLWDINGVVAVVHQLLPSSGALIVPVNSYFLNNLAIPTRLAFSFSYGKSLVIVRANWWLVPL